LSNRLRASFNGYFRSQNKIFTVNRPSAAIEPLPYSAQQPAKVLLASGHFDQVSLSNRLRASFNGYCCSPEKEKQPALRRKPFFDLKCAPPNSKPAFSGFFVFCL
jgi:hypothetical protein